MTVRVLIPAAYPAESFDAQRELLDRARVDIEVRDDGDRMLTFPEGWFAVTFPPQYDAVRSDDETRKTLGHAVPWQFSFDKGWLQVEEASA